MPNSAIALSVRPLDVPDPSAPLQKSLALQALMGQMDMQSLQIADAQRKMQRTAAVQALLGGGGDMNDKAQRLINAGYLDEGLGLRKSIAEEKKAGMDAQKTQGEINEQQSKAAQGLTAGFMSLPDDQKQAAFPAFRAEWLRQGLPAPNGIPEQFSPDMIPHLSMIASRGLSAKDSLERKDVRDATQPMPIQSTDIDSGATVRALGGATSSQFGKYRIPDNATTIYDVLPYLTADQEAMAHDGKVVLGKDAQGNAALMTPGAVAEQEAVASGRPIVAPVDSTARKPPGLSPDEMRARGDFAASKGTEAGNKVAKDWYDRANQVEQRILEEKRIDESVRQRQEQIELRKQNQGNQVITNTGKLGDDFRQEQAVKEWRTVQPLVASMHNAASKNTAASDLDMVYAIAKIFDPGSVVREGEQVMIVNAGGLPSKIQSVIGNLNGGQRLSTELRQELLDQAESRADNYKQAYDAVSRSYVGTANRFGLNPQDIVRDYKVTPKMDKGKGPRGVGSGTQADPFKIQGDDGWSLVPKGQYYMAPDGSVRQKQ